MARQNQQDNGNAEFTVPEGWANVLFDKAVSLNEQHEKLIAARKANREALRSLAAQDLLTDDEKELLSELYPVRTVNRGEEAPEGEPAAA